MANNVKVLLTKCGDVITVKEVEKPFSKSPITNEVQKFVNDVKKDPRIKDAKIVSGELVFLECKPNYRFCHVADRCTGPLGSVREIMDDHFETVDAVLKNMKPTAIYCI